VVTAVAILYASYQELAWVHAVFLGVGPAVLAIVAIAAVKLARSTNKHDPVLWAIAVVVAAVTGVSGAEIVWLFLAAGTFGAIHYGGGLPHRNGRAVISPLWLLGTAKGFTWTMAGTSVGALSWFFFKAGALTFGSGLAAVLSLHSGLVVQHHWLTEQQFVDASRWA
jgi:chromate transporter